MEWNDDILNTDCLVRYEAAIHAKGSALIWFRGWHCQTNMPAKCESTTRVQRPQRVHALKFQSVAIPNGLIAKALGKLGSIAAETLCYLVSSYYAYMT